MGEDRAKIAEIFSSVQGEGIYVGLPQVFVRFYGCNLRCSFCDTRLNHFHGFDVEELYDKIKAIEDTHHSISFTGGEPLMQKNFLKQILRLVKEKDGAITYLETNSSLPDALAEVIDYVDIIAMDLKLPSSTGMPGLWDEHRRFLEVALKKEVFVKAVICSSTKLEDLERAISLISSFDPKIPFVLQPNSFELGKELINKVQEWQGFCCERLADVRVVPQIHKLVGLK